MFCGRVAVLGNLRVVLGLETERFFLPGSGCLGNFFPSGVWSFLRDCRPKIDSRAPAFGPEARAHFELTLGSGSRPGRLLAGRLLVGWLAGWLDGWPASRLAGLHGWQADWLADWLAGWLAGWRAGWQPAESGIWDVLWQSCSFGKFESCFRAGD